MSFILAYIRYDLTMLNKILRFIERLVPRNLYLAGQPIYHYALAVAGALLYRFPSRAIHVVGITGTKGKSTTAELVNAILEATGKKTALMGTIRFKIADTSRPNRYKMSMPGRFFVQKFLRDAVAAGCDWAILEMTSEGAKQFRHKFIDLDALIFTNLAPEHIESHGSFEKYRDAKLAIARALRNSSKKDRVLVVNDDDAAAPLFRTAAAGVSSVGFSEKDAKPFSETGGAYAFTFRGQEIKLALLGKFNLLNALAAVTFAESQHIPPPVIKKGIESVVVVRGRAEFVREGQDFDVVVDYAHTPESLEALYGAFADSQNICVLGNTGGGRDTWKRPKMAAIAEKHCAEIILTNEDPYDENPQKIVNEMAAGVSDKKKLSVILDRREAIREALNCARELKEASPHQHIAVLITGKGTDPFIMGPRGQKTPWDDAAIVREELKKFLRKKTERV